MAIPSKVNIKQHIKVEELFRNQKRVLSVFRECWELRADHLNKLVKKKDITQGLLLVNRREELVVMLLEKNRNKSLEEIKSLANDVPDELRADYAQVVAMTEEWFGIISVHKRFLEIEKRCIPNFLSSMNARLEYFNALETALKTYTMTIQKSSNEQVIGKSIMKISRTKLSSFPTTAAASFKYGLYRILAASAFGSLIFGDPLPGGDLSKFLLWSIHVNIAGTIFSFVDIKYSIAIRIKSLTENMLFKLRPLLHEKPILSA